MTMEAFWHTYKLTIVAVAVLVLALLSSVVVVGETEQAVVVRTGEPVRVINRFRPNADFGQTGAGLVLRIPFFERVQRIDKRVLDLDMQRQQVLSSDQQRLQVDAFARFRIIDPVLMVQTAGTTDAVRLQLEPIFNSVLRQELGRRTFGSMLTAERGAAMTNIKNNLDAQARKYGAQVIDVRIKSTDLPEGTPLDAAYRRMETDRQREAATIRANGAKNAQIIRAEAEASASRTYAQAFNKDPQFYDFYRAMQSYDTTFRGGSGQTNVILGEDNEYLRRFANPGR
jgi:membrane protease subunit HflC